MNRILQILSPSLLLTVPLVSGCVERTIHIDSDPPGALVWLNDREVGRTPVDVGFLYYGRYDVRLEKDGYEPLLTASRAWPPVWDNLGLDFVAELMPVTLESNIHWRYAMEPERNDPDELIERARALRTELAPETGATDSAEAQAMSGQTDQTE